MLICYSKHSAPLLLFPGYIWNAYLFESWKRNQTNESSSACLPCLPSVGPTALWKLNTHCILTLRLCLWTLFFLWPLVYDSLVLSHRRLVSLVPLCPLCSVLELRVCMHTVSPIYTQGPSFIYLCWLSFFSSSLFYFLIFLLMHISSTY